jgi:hypothetical protein
MSEIQVNTINEYTGANGVTIDGVLLKDGLVNSGVVQFDSVTRLGNSTTGYQLETTSTTYADVPGFSVTMTPKSTTNKFVVLSDIYSFPTDTNGGLKLVQNSSGSYADLAVKYYVGPPSTTGTGVPGAIFGIFTPGVTSAVTVKIQAKSWAQNGSNRFRVNWYDSQSSLIIVELDI